MIILYPIPPMLLGHCTPTVFLRQIVKFLKRTATFTSGAVNMVNGISNAPGRMNFTPYILLATGMNVYGSKFQTGAKLIQERTRYVDMMGVQGPGS